MSYCICVKKLRKNIEKSARKIWSVRKNAYLCNPKRKERYFTELQVRKILGAIAQLVEQRTENPCVPSSILGGTTRNPRRCILRGFNFLILLQLRFVRPSCRRQVLGVEYACLPADTGIGRAPDSDKWSSNSTRKRWDDLERIMRMVSSAIPIITFRYYPYKQRS